MPCSIAFWAIVVAGARFKMNGRMDSLTMSNS
jgi:hypothetical protein